MKIKRDWSRVTFSYESKFNLIEPDSFHTVGGKRSERYAENCLLSTVQHSPYVRYGDALLNIELSRF